MTIILQMNQRAQFYSLVLGQELHCQLQARIQRNQGAQVYNLVLGQELHCQLQARMSFSDYLMAEIPVHAVYE
jgi:hypothetical protein